VTVAGGLHGLLPDKAKAEPSYKSEVEVRAGATTWKSLAALAQEYHMPIEEVIDVQQQFQRFDVNSTGEIGPEEFRSLVESRLSVQGMIPGMMETGCGRVRLCDVLQWLSTHAFDQEMLVPAGQRKLRELARTWGAPFPEVEDIHREFEKFDRNKSGVIEPDEFKHLLHMLLKLPKNTEFPQSRIDFFWKEVDRNSNGTICFQEFFLWFRRNFGAGNNPDGLLYQYYAI